MKNFWDGKPAGKKELLRLLTRDGKWLRWEGEKEDPNDPTKKPKAGCKDQVEEALLAALHSTNVVVLLGSGLIEFHSQKITVAASAIAEKKVCGHRS